ncbi:MAG: dockerin type I domain-containing protein [Planctomycetota bacterium]
MLASDLMMATHTDPTHGTDPSMMMPGMDQMMSAMDQMDQSGSMHMTHTHCGHHNSAALALVTDAQSTHVSVASGNWSDPATWRNGVVPTDGARVVITGGQTVTVDGVFNEAFKTVRVDGTLRFANDVDTQLRVDTLVSNCGGKLEIGTQTNPIAADVTAKLIFADDGEIDRTWDPTLISRGAILMGRTEIAGAQTTDKVTLASQPSQGATTLQLSSAPTNWNVGDQIVITGTQGATSDEVRTIASIEGTSVMLDQPLQQDHIAPKTNLNVYVANKTRNVEIRSENSEIGRRGHIMLAHTNDVTIDNAGFYQLGRTDKSQDVDDLFFDFDRTLVGNRSPAQIHYTVNRNSNATNVRGRYAIHFHRGGVDPSSTAARVSGSVVDGSPGWGFVNHSSHVDFTNNVAYGVAGSAYYTEVGDEIGSFDNNIAIRTVSPTNPIDAEDGGINLEAGLENQQFGVSGDGFWLSGNMVSVTNNISSGNSGHGMIFWNDGVVEEDKGRGTVQTANLPNGHLIPNRTSVPVWWAPLAEVSNNEISGSTIGLIVRYMHSDTYLGEGGSPFHTAPPQAYIDTLRPTIDGLTVWGSRNGVNVNYSERLSIKNAEIVGIGAQYRYFANNVNTGVGLDMGNSVTRGPGRLENISIEGFKMGMLVPRNDQWVVDNLTLKNSTDILIEEPRASARTLTMSNINFESLDGTAVQGDAANRKNIQFQPGDFGRGSGQPYFFALPDQITVDEQQIYWDIQNANYVVLNEPPDGNTQFQIPQEFVGKTNQQLQDMYGFSFGGNLIPDGAQMVNWIEGGVVGALSPANSNYPSLYDTTGAGENPDTLPGGPVPELTGNFLQIANGETLILTQQNLNTTDTDTDFSGLTYTVSEIQNGMFVHRGSQRTPITTFTHAELLGGVIYFVHDGSGIAPDYRVTVSDGTTTTGLSVPTIVFQQAADDDGGGPGNEDPPNEDPPNDDPPNGDSPNDDPPNDDPPNEDPGDQDGEPCEIENGHEQEGDVLFSTVQYGEGATANGAVPLLMDIYAPESPSDAPRPVVMLVHGGGFMAGDREQFSDIASRLARRGYVAVSISYRLGGQNPIASEEFQRMAVESIANSLTEFGEIQPAHLGSAVEDSVTAVQYLQSQAESLNIDPSRIAVWGRSAGAFIGLHLAYAVDDYGIDTPRPAQVISVSGGLGLPNTIEGDEAGFLQIHETGDEIVPYQEAQQISQQAESVGLDFQLETIQGGSHDVDYNSPSSIGGGATIMDRILMTIDNGLNFSSNDPAVGNDEEPVCEEPPMDDETPLDDDPPMVDEPPMDDEPPADDEVIPEDVNGDGLVSALDALQIINLLNRIADELANEFGHRADVNGDGRVSALDALQIINVLTREILFARNETEPMLQSEPWNEDRERLDDHLVTLLAVDQDRLLT